MTSGYHVGATRAVWRLYSPPVGSVASVVHRVACRRGTRAQRLCLSSTTVELLCHVQRLHRHGRPMLCPGHASCALTADVRPTGYMHVGTHYWTSFSAQHATCHMHARSYSSTHCHEHHTCYVSLVGSALQAVQLLFYLGCAMHTHVVRTTYTPAVIEVPCSRRVPAAQPHVAALRMERAACQ